MREMMNKSCFLLLATHENLVVVDDDVGNNETVSSSRSDVRLIEVIFFEFKCSNETFIMNLKRYLKFIYNLKLQVY